MKTTVKCLALSAALFLPLALAGAVQAQTLITDFNNFFEDELYAAWNDANAIIVSGPDSYSVTATGYGSNYVYIGEFGILGAGNNSLELAVTLSGPPEADGHLGPIITLIDGDGTNYNYAWYGQELGSHLLTVGVESPTWIGAAGTTSGLDLDTLTHMHMQLDPGGFGTMGAYTVEWENLNLIEDVVETTSLISDFNNFSLQGTYGSWDPNSSFTSGPNSFTVVESGFGGGYAPIATNVDGTGDTHVELDVTVNSNDLPNVAVLLQDADGTQFVYRWFSLAAGNHTLSFRLDTLTNSNAGETPLAIDQANSYPGDPNDLDLDFSTLSFFQLQVDPADPNSLVPYDVEFNNLRMKNIPGGFDTDNDSDSIDFLVWQRGESSFLANGGSVAEWEANYGNFGEALGSNSVAVPEPASMVLLLLSGMAILAFRRPPSN